jgi:predicted RNA binding protein YcfA (HicA-like mRNA interferase family)
VAGGWLRGIPKEAKKLFREVMSQDGWEVTRRASGHVLIEGPNQQKVFCSATPSDHRAIKNIKKDLAKAGLDLR